eukprot:GABV01000683.1.p2 GENE.GABV01000683.1~~GABV01000683.1.p2  ORF type:complete len:379 (+),score=94.90 GABV01000683.1:106-1137(+)
MLARFSTVQPDGTYVKPPHTKMSFGGMLFIRSHIVSGAGSSLANALTVAIRYSAVRRQGEPDPATGLEPQVLDYQMQQYRLFSLLATAYAFKFAGQEMSSLYAQLQKDLSSPAVDTSNLPEVHATAAGLKALTTWTTADGIEDARKCCGGHGYSHVAGLPRMLVDYLPAATYEGDNVLMALQTARFLIKMHAQATSTGTRVPQGVAYVVGEVRRLRVDVDAPSGVRALLEARAAAWVQRVAKRLEDAEKRLGKKEAWNACTVDLVRMARAHCEFAVLRSFVKALEGEEMARLDGETKRAMEELCLLYGLVRVEENEGDVLGPGICTVEDLERVKEKVRELLGR